MSKAPESENARPDPTGSESFLGYRAATLHYVDRKNNLAISKEMGISRFRVARLLSQAVETGFVTISITAPSSQDREKSEELRRRFDLDEALVLSPQSDNDAAVIKRAVATLAATHLQQTLKTGDTVGVAWGTTMDAVATAAAFIDGTFAKSDVVQLFGGVPTLTGSLHASELLRRFSVLLGGETYALHSPLILPDIATAAGLREEASVSRTLAKIRHVDIAILGIGSWDPSSSRLKSVLSAEDVTTALNAGIVSDICGVLLDKNGTPQAPNLTNRMISITLDELRAIPLRMAITTGAEKVVAIRSALAARAINSLITDTETAKALLDED